MHVAIRDDGRCTLTSSVVFPGGAERVVCMVGELGSEARLLVQHGGRPPWLLVHDGGCPLGDPGALSAPHRAPYRLT